MGRATGVGGEGDGHSEAAALSQEAQGGLRTDALPGACALSDTLQGRLAPAPREPPSSREPQQQQLWAVLEAAPGTDTAQPVHRQHLLIGHNTPGRERLVRV